MAKSRPHIHIADLTDGFTIADVYPPTKREHLDEQSRGEFSPIEDDEENKPIRKVYGLKDASGTIHAQLYLNQITPTRTEIKNFMRITTQTGEPFFVLDKCHRVVDGKLVYGRIPQPYLGHIQAFLTNTLKPKTYADDAHSGRDTGLIEQDGIYYDIYDLPKNLHIRGDLHLEDSDIERLPEGLRVDGMLNVQSTRSLRELPKNLKVGDILVSGSALTELPEGLEILHGSLNLKATQIAKLNKGLIVPGDLDIRRTPITELPEGADLGSCYLEDTNVATLGKGIRVRGNLSLVGSNVTALPEGLVVDGNLNLTGTGIWEIPPDAVIKGKIIGQASPPPREGNIAGILAQGPQRRGREPGK